MQGQSITLGQVGLTRGGGRGQLAPQNPEEGPTMKLCEKLDFELEMVGAECVWSVGIGMGLEGVGGCRRV